MSDFTVDISALKRLDRSFIKAGKDYKTGRKKFLKKIGVLVQGMARKYCPESPTIGDYARQNKSGKTKRNRSSITTGSLRDSITVQSTDEFVSIFVQSNSRGGKYGEKIHDRKGTSGKNGWNKRGPRTKQKGTKADEKFIFRAGKDTEKEQAALIDDLVNSLIKGIGV